MARPRAININPAAVRDLAKAQHLPLKAVAEGSKVAESHLHAALNEAKGLSEPAIRRLADTLHCEAGTIAPTLVEPRRFLAWRPGDAA